LLYFSITQRLKNFLLIIIMAKIDFENSEEFSVIAQLAQRYPAGDQRADFYKALRVLSEGV
jgi:hypothetical protein